MDFKILYSETALADLEALMYWSWLNHEDKAERFGAALLDHVSTLGSFPFLGARLPLKPEVRKLFHSPIRVYYRVHEKRRVVEILRFSHAVRREPNL